MLNAGIPNVEMHIYARGHHPGDKTQPDEPLSTGGLADRGFIAYGTWPDRMVDWMRDLGLLGKPGVITQAAKDSDAFVHAPPPVPRPPRPAGQAPGAAPMPAAPVPATPARN